MDSYCIFALPSAFLLACSLLGCTEYLDHSYKRDTQALGDGVLVKAQVLGTQVLILPGQEVIGNPYKLILSYVPRDGRELCIHKLVVRSGAKEETTPVSPPDCGEVAKEHGLDDKSIFFNYGGIEAEIGSNLFIVIEAKYAAESRALNFQLVYAPRHEKQFVLYDLLDDA